ncbi:TadE/TadG family type IV pilus assembly protein [Chthonobacter albigriseus]|uniref:TadE/TadG family type IV pilus assembly protein n=1 Tax=Chthonobacter albigriseus TaxID=1683161 RepID=UPI0015EF6FCC|nr:pilus assembly protein TadG-related protein [Chthonobacter albigriseus]
MNTFSKDRRGSTAVVLAVALPVLIMATGSLLDYSSAYSVRDKAQKTTDAAVLTIAKMRFDANSKTKGDKGKGAVKKMLKEAVSDDLEFDVEVGENLESGERTITVHAKTVVRTDFMRLFGQPEIAINVSSTAQYRDDNYAAEIAFVINTGATMMTARKSTALHDALNATLDQFSSINAADEDRVRVAVVPFQSGVTVPYVDMDSFYYGNDFPDPPSLAAHQANLFNASINMFPTRCVVERAYPFETSIAPVSASIASRYRVVFDVVDPAVPCPNATIVPVTTDFEAVRSTVATFNFDSGTNGAVGLVWGWNMLTPDALFSESGNIPLGPDHKSLKRILLYITDGENTATLSNQTPSVVDDHALTLCTKIKADDITIVTINIDGAGSEALLKACASSPDRYKKVPAPELPKVLEGLAGDLSGYTPVRLMN